MPSHATTANQRRYDLHYSLRKAGVKISSKNHTVIVPANAWYTVRVWTWIRELQRTGYSIQISIPEPKPKLGRQYRYMGDSRNRQFVGLPCWLVTSRRPKSPKEVFVWFETGETCRVRKNDLKALDPMAAKQVQKSVRIGLDYLNTIE